MRRLIPALLLISCTSPIEKMERHDKSMTDSALSVLDGLTAPTVDTVSIVRTRTIEKVKTIEKIKYLEVESAPVFSMMRPIPMPLPLEKRRCDTVYIRDTVWISR